MVQFSKTSSIVRMVRDAWSDQAGGRHRRPGGKPEEHFFALREALTYPARGSRPDNDTARDAPIWEAAVALRRVVMRGRFGADPTLGGEFVDGAVERGDGTESSGLVVWRIEFTSHVD